MNQGKNTQTLAQAEPAEDFAGQAEAREFHLAAAKLLRLATFLAEAQDRRGYGLGIASETVAFIRKIGYEIPLSEEMALREDARARVDAMVQGRA
jgi:hypothetical protein